MINKNIKGLFKFYKILTNLYKKYQLKMKIVIPYLKNIKRVLFNWIMKYLLTLLQKYQINRCM